MDFKRSLVTGLVALVLSTSSCKKDEPVEPYNPNQPSTETPSTPIRKIPITYSLGKNNLDDIKNYGSGLIVFNSKKDFIVGDILAGGISEKTPYAILEKVNHVYQDGKAFGIKPATLEESVKSGECDVIINHTYSDFKSASENNQVLLTNGSAGYNFHVDINKVLYDADNNKNTLDDQVLLKGFVDFNASENIKMKINSGKVYANFHSLLQGKSELTISTTLPSFHSNGELILQEYSFNPIVFMLGVVPVEISPTISLPFSYDVSLDSQSSLKTSELFYNEVNLIYDTISHGESNWVLEKSPRNNFKINEPELSVNIDAKVSASLSPEVSLLFYNVAGPYVNIEAYSKFKANTTENPWWVLSGGFNANLGFSAERLSNKIENYNKKIPLLEEKIIAQADGAFPGNNPELDSLIIQPGPFEGKDASILRDRWKDCSETYNQYKNDSTLKIGYTYFTGCVEFEERTLISFPLSNIPSNLDVSSAKLKLYGQTFINYVSRNPHLLLSSLNDFWDESSITWLNKPESEFIEEKEFPNCFGKEIWGEFDITSELKEWVAGKPNYGFEISTIESESSSYFYSSEYSDKSKRPKLVIYYNKE